MEKFISTDVSHTWINVLRAGLSDPKILRATAESTNLWPHSCADHSDRAYSLKDPMDKRGKKKSRCHNSSTRVVNTAYLGIWKTRVRLRLTKSGFVTQDKQMRQMHYPKNRW